MLEEQICYDIWKENAVSRTVSPNPLFMCITCVSLHDPPSLPLFPALYTVFVHVCTCGVCNRVGGWRVTAGGQCRCACPRTADRQPPPPPPRCGANFFALHGPLYRVDRFWENTLRTHSPIFCTFRMLLSKGTMSRLHQRQKINSFSILRVADIARHGLVKDTREGTKERQMPNIPYSVLWF